MWLFLACTGTESPDTPDPRPPLTDSSTLDDSGPADSGPTDSGGDNTPQIDALCINELMADNEAALLTEDGASPDWVELHNPTDTAISLAGWRLTDDEDDPDRHTFTDDLTVAPGAFQLLYADNDPDAGADHLGMALSADGGMLGLFAPDGSGQVIHYGSIEADFSIAREDDCCTENGCLIFDFRGTPGSTNNPPVPVEVEVFPLGSTWRYLDTDAAPGPGWKEAGFDDSGWQEGAGPLGFGDHHQVTTVQGGPDNDRTPAIYFRKTFTLDAPAVELEIDLMRDDGALVWLNGQEALRSNLPDGDIIHETLASAAISSPNESVAGAYGADAAQLVEGVNVLAVEVHQAAATSSDLTFDLAVRVSVYE